MSKERQESGCARSECSSGRARGGGINDSWVRRLLTVASVRLLGRIRPRQGQVLFLTKRHCVKYGPLKHLPEASTMEFVARNTPIPVPRIYWAFKRKGCTYIVMERVEGESIVHSWKSRSAESKAHILQQLKDMVESMRRLNAPSSVVANVDGGSIWDCRLPGKTLDFGPFDDIAAFHSHLRGGLDTVSDGFPSGVNELIRMHDRDWGDPTFTHGDLSSLNILAKGDTITGIVDWETAGWYPYYWEYTTAEQVNPRNTFWREEIKHFLQTWPEELQMEKIRQTHFGDV